MYMRAVKHLWLSGASWTLQLLAGTWALILAQESSELSKSLGDPTAQAVLEGTSSAPASVLQFAAQTASGLILGSLCSCREVSDPGMMDLLSKPGFN